MTFLDNEKVEVVTGVNLPMLIKLAGLRETGDLQAAARQAGEAGRAAIWVAADS